MQSIHQQASMECEEADLWSRLFAYSQSTAESSTLTKALKYNSADLRNQLL